MATKNVGLRKLFNIVLEANTTYLRKFLERHGVYLDSEYYEKIERIENAMSTAMQPQTDNNTFDVKENAKTAVYVHIAAAIEQLWNERGATLATKPPSYTSKIIFRYKNEVKAALQEAMDKIFLDLEDMILKIKEKELGDNHALESEEVYRN